MLRALLTLAFVVSATQAAQADFIVGGSFTNVGVAQPGGQLNAQPTVTNNNVAENNGIITNAVTMSITLTQTGVAFSTNFDLDGVFGAATEYAFTVSLTNLTGREIPGLDIRFSSPAGVIAVFDVAPASNIDSGPFALEHLGAGNPFSPAFGVQIIRFGGFSGGGPVLANGDTTSVSFHADVASFVGAQSVTMSFTANPEPTSLLLGASLLIPGAWFARRRKSVKPAPTNPAV